MLFSSITFIYFFLPILLMLYGAASVICPKSTGHTLQNLVLCMMSCLFYAWGEPYYIFLMLVQILIVYGLSLIMERKQEKTSS